MEPEEYKVGDWVTLLQWVNSTDRSWCGDCLKVNAIDWPFLAVSEWKGNKVILPHIRLDARLVDIKKLSNEYVTALNSMKGQALG